MEGKNKEFSTQDSFSAYLKTAVRNTKIKYIKSMSKSRRQKYRLGIQPMQKQSPVRETTTGI